MIEYPTIKKVFEKLNDILNIGLNSDEVTRLYYKAVYTYRPEFEKAEPELAKYSDSELERIAGARAIDSGFTISEETDDLVEELASFIENN